MSSGKELQAIENAIAIKYNKNYPLLTLNHLYRIEANYFIYFPGYCQSYHNRKNFFRFMNIPIGEGKVFSTDNEVLVDRRLQKNYGAEIIGKSFRMSFDNKYYNITGLCETDYTYSLYEKEAMGFVFMSTLSEKFLFSLQLCAY